MPNLKIYKQPEFPAVLKWQALSFMRMEWPGLFQGDYLYMSETYPPHLRPVHFALIEGDCLLSYAAVMRLRVKHAGQQFEACGFGNMFTFPPYRGQGYGRQVLETATEYIQHSSADLAILFCQPRLEAFYAAAGWELSRSQNRIGRSENFIVDPDIRMMLFLTEKGRCARSDFDHQPFVFPFPW